MQFENLDTFQQISIDTRTLKAGELFFALYGENFNGHDFVDEAAKKGAIAAVVEKKVKADIPLIIVKNSFQALYEFARRRRELVNIPIIALTGSCGKTTTKTALASIFSRCGNTLATEKNLNNNIGVALTLLKLTPAHKYAVIEMGASLKNEISISARMARPNIAIITNAAPVHLQGFGDLAGVANVKGDILRQMADDGIAILNADDYYLSYWKELVKSDRIITFGLNNHADISAYKREIKGTNAQKFILQTRDAEITINLPLCGAHNMMNALAASAAALAANVPLAAIKSGLESVVAVERRMVPVLGQNGVTLIDDSYNANPRSMQAAIEVLMAGAGEKIMVIGDMLELAKDAELYHVKLGEEAKNAGVDRLFAVGDFTKLTVQAFGASAKFFENRSELVDHMQQFLRSECRILIKGSKANKMWEFVRAFSKSE